MLEPISSDSAPADNRFISPLHIKEQTSFQRIDFGPVAAGPEIARLRQSMNAALFRQTDMLPAPLQEEARATIRGYSGGGGDFFRLFYTPMWSFLHHVPVSSADRPNVRLFEGAEDLLEAHALSLFLHLWDDHLCDAQLTVNMLRLQVRTLAWGQFAVLYRKLAERLGHSRPESLDRRADDYIVSLHETDRVANLEQYELRFRRQMAICTIVPAIIGYAHGVNACAEPLVRLMESFGFAWRLLDDVQDIYADACDGKETAVWLELNREGREHWQACREQSRTAGRPQPDTWDALTVAVMESGALDRLFFEIVDCLREAIRIAHTQGWSGIADEIRMCGSGLPIQP